MKIVIVLAILGTLIVQRHSEILVAESSELIDRKLPLDTDETEIVEKVKVSFTAILAGENTLFNFEELKDDNKEKYKPQMVSDHEKLATDSAVVYAFIEKKEGEDQKPIVLFWMFVLQKKEPVQAEGDKKGPKKQKKKEMSFEFTNGIVTSKIKIEFGFGDKSLLEGFIKRSCAAFAQKVEQSVFGLGTVEPELSLVMENLNEIFPAPKKVDKAIFTFKKPSAADKFNKFDFQVAGVSAKTEFVKEEHPDLDDIIKELSPEGSGAKEHHQDEYLIYKIEPEFTESNNPEDEQDDSSYIDSFYLILFHTNRKVTIMINSKHFSDSVEISVNSKFMVIQTVYSLLYNVIVHTFGHFIELDAATQDCDNLLPYLNTQIKKLHGDDSGADNKFKIKIGDKHHMNIDFTEEADDVLTKIAFVRSTEQGTEDPSQKEPSIAEKQAYFPLKSQYCMSPFILSFIEKMKQDYAKLALSELIRAPMSNNENEIKSVKEILGSRYGELFVKDIPIKDDHKISFTGSVPGNQQLSECKSLTSEGKNWSFVLCKRKNEKNENLPASLEYIWVAKA